MPDLELVEPVFVLRASDPLAPSLVRQWARRRELAIGRGRGGDPDDVARARRLAIEMEQWSAKDAVRQAVDIQRRFRERFGRRSAEVIKLRRPE